MRKIWLLFIVALFFTACSEDSESYESTPVRRTVLVYMAAENNLAYWGFDKTDIKEMLEASKALGDDCCLVVYYDGLGTNPPYICRLRDGNLTDSVSMQEGLSADPAVLERILRFTRNKYPATSYGLVLWGHASGWIIDNRINYSVNSHRSYGGVTGTGIASFNDYGNYWMNIPDMANAIANAMETEHLTFIAVDCCNMGSIEVAYELRNVTDYYLASPSEIPGSGAPYQQVIQDLFSTSPEFYCQYIDHYYNFYYDYYKSSSFYSYLSGKSVPLLAVRSSALDDLATATAQLLTTIPDKLKPQGDLDFDGITCYGYTDTFGSRVFFNYDMYQTLKYNTTPEDFALWAPYYDAAIPYSRYSAQWESVSSALNNHMQNHTTDANQCGTLAMFFPHNVYSNTIPNFNRSIHQYQWSTVVNWSQYGWVNQ